MGWLAARTRIAAILAAVSITEPVEATIARVYENPWETVEDSPCFIFVPPPREVERGSSLRIKTYTLMMRCLVYDDARERASDMVDAFVEATIDAFDSDLTLNGSASDIKGPRAPEGAKGFEYAGRRFVGIDCFLTVVIKEAKAFG
jgi:hypothetical protein